MSENILSLNVPNIITVGLILAIWAALFVVIAQGLRHLNANSGSGS